ncbi:hypothetical protein CLAFUW4_09530 [Fulvia fulva]|uniref:Aminoglycoside phosphotransferase domain-containing protein n=1 Tax=Passalora fulva TaxID=5499 RepID=A0A9Q8PH78_PASFU|nr:uncharacterized protein CLAFUR5_09626 [Fulvia fulva]KAK4614226.1 hypothetical protein CLAFUR4_09536 [Fulvia fulva]KAK4614667.1 hypothetical protein CLAFUR0_09527 [Fulvia fulva]UJO22408.1 hypothetical protein CLAFUR5_09626 [Fulvia fulva]WPV20231.1 hypothetical protein CLAFUW4_09530 [Fulvia fulva]WPV35715.1 hypothetical protein CLAFUW7_09531 [Fulvia fulva]
MDCPRNIVGSASQLFCRNKDSLEYKALVALSCLSHPQRVILAGFILNAADREVAAQYLLQETSGRGPATMYEFLADWIFLVTKVRPTIDAKLDRQQKQALLESHGGACCFSRAETSTVALDDYVSAFIVPPDVFDHLRANEGTRPFRMLAAFIGNAKAGELESVLKTSTTSSPGHLKQFLLLSKDAFELFASGALSMEAMPFGKKNSYTICVNCLAGSTPDWVSNNIVTFSERSGDLATAPNPLLFEVNRRFSEALSWIQVAEHMKSRPAQQCRSATHYLDFALSRPIVFAMRHVGRLMPVLLRSQIYQALMQVGHRLYGPTLSERMHRLPFGLYLRIAEAGWYPRHRAEFETLRLVEKYTTIPAPRPIDTLQYQGKSYLLMTRVPGRPIGTLLTGMTDEQLQKATQDLGGYLEQLRSIPNNSSTGAQICNSVGGGILDWRIGESQLHELTFATVTDFHQFLTADYSRHLQEKARPSHDKKHNIVFTHGDLNPRNILADETGAITGIVDWECSGWYPEYWEYTKAHFVVRSTIRWLADVIDQIFTGYREELKVENMLSDLGF